ncbi:TPA: hypothetical protein QIB15_004889 [Klebsiella aerogenes]|nr:hypothetical protein [Klebsiella aerogenes]
MTILKNLEDKFNKISSDSESYIISYSDSVRLNETKVVVSKGVLYNIRPYEIERAGFKIGKKLNKLPANVKNTHIYHFDSQERISLIEIFGQTSNIINKEFCIYEGDNLERIYFTSAGMLRNISLSVYNDGLIEKDFNWGMYGCSVSDYVYEDSILKKIYVQQKEHAESSFTEFEVVFSYKNAIIDTIKNVFPNGYEEQRYPAR